MYYIDNNNYNNYIIQVYNILHMVLDNLLYPETYLLNYNFNGKKENEVWFN